MKLWATMMNRMALQSWLALLAMSLNLFFKSFDTAIRLLPPCSKQDYKYKRQKQPSLLRSSCAFLLLQDLGFLCMAGLGSFQCSQTAISGVVIVSVLDSLFMVTLGMRVCLIQVTLTCKKWVVLISHIEFNGILTMCFHAFTEPGCKQ